MDSARTRGLLTQAFSDTSVKEQVLDGLYEDVAKSGRLRRASHAVLSSTIQHLSLTARERRRLGLDDGNAVDDRCFGARFSVWRLANLQVAACAMVIRLAFTFWSAFASINTRVRFTTKCRDEIISAHGAGDQGPDSLPDSLSDEMVTGLTGCSSYMGISPTGAFPLFPDHLRDAMLGFELMAAAQTLVRCACELLALYFTWLAYSHWPWYGRSRRHARTAFLLGMLPPFVLALTFPMAAGINAPLLIRRTCDDVIATLRVPAAELGDALADASGWRLNLPLPSGEAFCRLPPAEWGGTVEEAMDEAGVFMEHNESSGLTTCRASSHRRALCANRSHVCGGCFADIEVEPQHDDDDDGDDDDTSRGPTSSLPLPSPPTNLTVRNPCLDFVTIEQLCAGRDELHGVAGVGVVNTSDARSGG